MLSSKDSLLGCVVNTVDTDRLPLKLVVCFCLGSGKISRGVIQFLMAPLLVLTTGSLKPFSPFSCASSTSHSRF